jgi:hypothetical protein
MSNLKAKILVALMLAVGSPMLATCGTITVDCAPLTCVLA